MTITRERLEQLAVEDDLYNYPPTQEELNELARIALASLEAEPYGYVHKAAYEQSGSCGLSNDHEAYRYSSTHIAVYTAPPAPVVVPEALADNIDADDHPLLWSYHNGWNACRAAMQGKAEPVSNDGDELKPAVRDALTKALAAMEFMGDTLNNLDAVCSEDVDQVTPAFESIRSLLAGNSPVIPDGWVACSERMPSAGDQVLAYRPSALESNDPLIKMAKYIGMSAHGHGFDCYCKPTHWMPMPTAPQQKISF